VKDPRRSEPLAKGDPLSSGEDWFEAGFDEDAFDLFSFVALDFDATIFDGASDAAGFAHDLCELLLFGEADADEVLYHGDSLAPAMGGLTDDVHAAAAGVFLAAFGGLCGNGWRWVGRSFWQAAETVQSTEGLILQRIFPGAQGLALLLLTHWRHSTRDCAKLTLFFRDQSLIGSIQMLRKRTGLPWSWN